MGDNKTTVERGADPVSSEVPNYSVVESLGVAFDNATDDAQRSAWLYGLDRTHGGLMGSLDEECNLLADLAHQERGIGVAVYSTDERSDIDVADIAIYELSGIGNSVADDFVQA